MKFVRNELLEDQLLNELMEEIKDPSRGHPSVTDLIYCLTKSYYRLEYPDFAPSRKTKLFFVIGLGLEKALLRDSKHPKEGIYESVYYHIDSLDYLNVTELKSTRAKQRTPDEFPGKWLQQHMSYCKTQGVTMGDFAVIYPIPPELICWTVSYTQNEIDANWLWVQERKAIWDKAQQDKEVPTPFKYNEDWECVSCEFLMLCQAKERYQ